MGTLVWGIFKIHSGIPQNSPKFHESTIGHHKFELFPIYFIVVKSHFRNILRERSHMTSAAEGVGGFEMLTVADKGGGRGSKPC